MEFENEDDFKQHLGVESWRNVSQDAFLELVTELPNVSKDVAIKIVDQFPDFKELVLDAFGRLQSQATDAVGLNWKSQKKVHKALAQYREVLSRELERDDLSTTDRFAVLQLLRDAIDLEASKDTEHKEFLLRTISMVAAATVVVVGAGVTVLGGRGRIGKA